MLPHDDLVERTYRSWLSRLSKLPERMSHRCGRGLSGIRSPPVETRSWATTALVLGIFLLPHLGSRLITGWLYNGAGSSVLIAGLFHSMHNAIVNSTGLVAVVGLPQFEVLVIMAGIVVLAAVIIAVAARGRLGLKRSSGLSAAT